MNVKEPVKGLKSESCSPRPEPEDSDPVRDLTNELFSMALEAELREVLNPSARPLFSEPAEPREAVRDLNSEDFSPRLEDEPIEDPRLMARPFEKKVASPIEFVIDLKNDP